MIHFNTQQIPSSYEEQALSPFYRSSPDTQGGAHVVR
jgi:hypothetical protein